MIYQLPQQAVLATVAHLLLSLSGESLRMDHGFLHVQPVSPSFPFINELSKLQSSILN